MTSNDDIETVTLYEYSVDGVTVTVDYARLKHATLRGQPVPDPGGVSVTITDENHMGSNSATAALDPGDALKMADAITRAANRAMEAERNAANVVPEEWTRG